MDRPFIVYTTTHIPTGRYYIGVHREKFPGDGYRGSGHLIKRLLKTHPPEEFDFKIHARFATKEEAYELEDMLVQPWMLDSKVMPLLLNLARGGEGGNKMGPTRSPEHRTRLSEGVRRAQAKPEYHEKMSKAKKGRTHTPEWIEKRIAARVATVKRKKDEKKALASLNRANHEEPFDVPIHPS